MFHNRQSVWRVAAVYWAARFARTAPLYTDEAMATLGLPATASLDEAKRAFRTLIMIHHPDRGGDTAKAQDIILAWTQLKDGTTIPRPYQYSRPPTPPPSYHRPPVPPRAAPTPPPRPTYTPTPRPQPTGNPQIKVTWRDAERKTGGQSRPDAKDKQRIDDMVTRAVKSRGNIPEKLKALANQMANSIDSVDKALRRGRACEEHPDVPGGDVGTSRDFQISTLSQIFYARAMMLAGV